MRQHVRHIFAAFVMMSAALSASSAQIAPPIELCSPTQQYCVTILETALPGADPDNEFFTIAVRRGKNYLSKNGTEGYLLNAFWSPDGKYVAVNNRRANSGDYLWVFRLSDGRALKKPVDAGPERPTKDYEKQERALIRPVTVAYPDLTYDALNKLFLEADGWTPSGELRVTTDFSFWKKGHVLLSQAFKIEGDKLVLTHEHVKKP